MAAFEKSLIFVFVYLIVRLFLCVGESHGQEIEIDALTSKYLVTRGIVKPTVAGYKPYIPFLQQHNHECRHLLHNFKSGDSSHSLVLMKECTNCYQRFVLDSKSDNPNGLTLVLYREPKYREYLFWLMKMIFQMQVDIIDVNSSSPQSIDLCKSGRGKPVVILSRYADFDFDIKSSILTLKGIQYTCSNSNFESLYKPARISKLLMLAHDPLLLLWRQYVTSHLPSISSSEGDFNGMLGFDWSRWDQHISHKIRSENVAILRAASQDLRVEIGQALMSMPKSIVMPLRSDELTDRQEVDTYLFIDLYLFIRGVNFSYSQVNYRREITPTDSIVFHSATNCLSSTFMRKNTSTGIDQLVQRYVSAAFSAPSISCQVQYLFSQNPFMKEFPLALPSNLTCDKDRDVSDKIVQNKHKISLCKLRYPDRAYKEEITNYLPVALVGGYDKQTYDVRRLFEYGSSQYMGALKSNMQVAASFPAESYCGIRVGGIHTTPFNFQPLWSSYDLELRFDPATLRRCRTNLLFKLTEAVIVLDDPFLFLWRRHFNPQSTMFIRQLFIDSPDQDSHQAPVNRRRLRRNSPPVNKSPPRKPPASIDEIFSYWDETMNSENSASPVFGDGSHLFFHAPRKEMLPTRSLFPVSYERLLEDAFALFSADDGYSRLTVNETSPTDNAFLGLLKFAHVDVEDIYDRIRCSFAFVQEGEALVKEIANARRFYDQHPQYLCRVQSWARNHTSPLHRRLKFLYPLTNICGQEEVTTLVTTSLGKCRETFAVRKYRDDTSVSPSVLIAPRNSPDARIVRSLIEHSTGLYSGSTETSYNYKGVFPADEYCGRRMGIIHSTPDFLSFSQREDGITYLRIESKSVRTRCRRGVITNFAESVVLIKDPFVLMFETLFPQLATASKMTQAKLTPSADIMFSTILQSFSDSWTNFNASMQNNAALATEKMKNIVLKRVQQLLQSHYTPNFTAASNQQHEQRHFLGSAVDEYVHSPYYETSNPSTFFFGSLEAIVDSAKRLSELRSDVDVSQHVFQEKEAFFAMLQTSKLIDHVTIDHLKCGYAFVSDESVSLLQRLEVVRRFYKMYPRVLCRVQEWVGQIFAPHESSVYAIFPVLPHAQHCAP